MAEYSIEQTVVNKAERAGWLVRKLKYPGRNGAPDRMFIRNGRVVFIEFKDRGKKPDPLQKRELKRMRDQGIEAYSIDNVAEALEILGVC